MKSFSYTNEHPFTNAIHAIPYKNFKKYKIYDKDFVILVLINPYVHPWLFLFFATYACFHPCLIPDIVSTNEIKTDRERKGVWKWRGSNSKQNRKLNI